MHLQDIPPGAVFGKWTVIERAPNNKGGNRQFLCRCECGLIQIVGAHGLLHGRSQGCRSCRTHRKHGLSRSREYLAWVAMNHRCNSGDPCRSTYYRDRGVTVCEAWQRDFLAFLQHVGPKPGPEYSIDRIDPNGNYEPGNVRWATASEQQQNTRWAHHLTYQGRTMSIPEWSVETGIPSPTISGRYRLGAPMEVVFTKGRVKIGALGGHRKKRAA